MGGAVSERTRCRSQEHTLLASNVIWTRISPLTGSFSKGRSLIHWGRAHIISADSGREQPTSAIAHIAGRARDAQARGEHSLVPVINSVVVHEHRLNLHGAQESWITRRAIVDVQSQDREIRCHIAAAMSTWTRQRGGTCYSQGHLVFPHRICRGYSRSKNPARLEHVAIR